ncbi:MAG TPA: GNAT family protein [Syntrophomonadaceae bacterium]|nr:GNAT family protein [Syntrophomonadaceae bacterium]
MKAIRRIEGKQVYLAPMDMNEALDYVGWLNDPETMIFVQSYNHVYNRVNEEQYLQNVLEKGEPQFSIHLCENDRHIGGCGLINLDWINRRTEIGIMIGAPDFRNHGYGKEALLLLLDYIFNIMNLNSVSLRHYEYNHRAARCYEKCGFKPVGRIRQARLINGQFYDDIIMDILAQEFPGSLYKVHLQNLLEDRK